MRLQIAENRSVLTGTLYIHPTMLQQIEGCVPFQNYVDVHPHTSARLNKCPYWDVESIEASLLLLTSGMVEMFGGGKLVSCPIV